MPKQVREQRLLELVSAFTELGPAWVRWVHACLPAHTVSYPRLRLLSGLKCHEGGMTMKQLATALEVTPRRVTALVDALEEDGLVERFAHPVDGRSTVVVITKRGLAQHREAWTQHQDEVAVAFADLSNADQEQLLAITYRLTDVFRARLEAKGTVTDPEPALESTIIRRSRRLRTAPPGIGA